MGVNDLIKLIGYVPQTSQVLFVNKGDYYYASAPFESFSISMIGENLDFDDIGIVYQTAYFENQEDLLLFSKNLHLIEIVQNGYLGKTVHHSSDKIFVQREGTKSKLHKIEHVTNTQPSVQQFTAVAVKSIESFEESFENIRQLNIKRQNFNLTELDFKNMVAKLMQGDESMFEQIFLFHFEDCIHYLKKHHKAATEIAYDIAMEALLQFRHKLLTYKITYGNLLYLYTKIASQLYVTSLAKENKVRASISAFVEIEDDVEEKLLVIKNAWAILTEEDKKLLEDYYYKDIPLAQIAEVENKSIAALRKQKQRAIKRLRDLFNINHNVK